jgi:hypothetical protein
MFHSKMPFEGKDGFIDYVLRHYSFPTLKPAIFRVDSSNFVEMMRLINQIGDGSYVPVVIDKSNLDRFYAGISVGSLTTPTMLEMINLSFLPITTMGGHNEIVQAFKDEIQHPVGGGIKINFNNSPCKIEFYGLSRSVNCVGEDLPHIRDLIKDTFKNICKNAISNSPNAFCETYQKMKFYSQY